MTLLEDITHLAEISRLKSEFIADASHELRTPLTSVQMGIYLLLEDSTGSLSERQKDILQVCRDDTARLDHLMRELLDLSKIESGEIAPVRSSIRAGQLVRDAVEALRLQIEAKGLTLATDVAPPGGARGPRADRTGHRQPRHQRRSGDARWRHDYGICDGPLVGGGNLCRRHGRRDPA